MGQFLDDTPTQEYQPKGKFIDLDSSQYNASDIMPYRKRENSGFTQKAKALFGENVHNAKTAVNAVQSGTLSTIGGLGGMLRIAGDQLKVPDKERKYLKEKYKYSDAEIDQRFNAVGNYISKWGEKINYVYGDMAMANHINPSPEVMKGEFYENPSMERAISLGFGAVPSLASAYITRLMGAPLLGMTMLSGLEAEDVYSDAVEKGKSQSEANALFGSAFAGVFLLEKFSPIGKVEGGKELVFGLKNKVVKKIKDVTMDSIREGFTEGSQQLWENFVRKIGLDRTQKLHAGVVDNFIAGGLSGVAISSVGGDSQVIYIRDDAKFELVKPSRPLEITADEYNAFVELVGEAIAENGDVIDAVAQEEANKTIKTLEQLEEEGALPKQMVEMRNQLVMPREQGGFGLSQEDAHANLAVLLAGATTLSEKSGESLTEWFDRVNPKLNVGEQQDQDGITYNQEGQINRDENFKKWFGDSKVVDEKGEPLVVYHGTNDKFDTFYEEKTGKIGFYFEKRRKEAERYGGNIVEVFVNIKNPAPSEAIKKAYDEADGGNPRKKAHERLKKEGYDGIIRTNEIVAFSPTQIKSVNNKGTFDPNDPNILNQGFVEGFGFIEDETDTQYLIDGTWYSKRIVTEDMIVQGRTPTAEERNKKLIREAKKYFGVTDNWNEVGYVTTDGSLLDFSGKNQGAMGGDRTLDHREIGYFGEDSTLETDMIEFMDFGNVRFKPESNGFEVHRPLNDKQKKVLAKFIKEVDGEVLLDMEDTFNKRQMESIEYNNGTSSQRIFDDIDRYFNGKKQKKQSEVSKFRNQFRQQNRGSIQFQDTQTIINLYKEADMSTFLHETGHLFMREIERLVESGNADEQLLKDFKTLQDNYGDMSERESQENFARAFEGYLLEGKAPNAQLQSAFDKFKMWLTNIYKSLKSLNVKLNNDVRSVFDRLLAGENVDIKRYQRVSKKESKPDIFNRISALIKNKEKFDDFLDKKMVDEIEDAESREESRKANLEITQDELAVVKEMNDFLRKRINISKNPDIAEEAQEIPKQLRTTDSNGLSPDEALDEVNNAGLGLQFDTIRDMAHFYRTSLQSEKDLRSAVKELKIKYTRSRETTRLKAKISAIKRGFRQGKKIAKEEVKAVQDIAIGIINNSDLETESKGKFISTIKNIQTVQQLLKALPDIESRIQKLVDTSIKNDITKKIKRALKFTKAVKQGTKSVGKYDYETNVFFNEIRGYYRLNQAEAMKLYEQLPNEYENHMDLIRRRFLSLQANGKKSSVELYRQVLEDIWFMKNMGENAKSEQDYMKKLARKDLVERASEIMATRKDDPKSIKTRIVNMYRQGFSNTYSMLNSIFGKDFAEEFDPEFYENQRETAIFEITRDTAQQGAEIFGYENFRDLQAELSRMMSEIYFIKDLGIGVSYQITKMDLLDIYNSLKNDLLRQRYYNAFGEDQIFALMEHLNVQEKMFADYMQEVAQSYREVLNQRKIETTGLDLGQVENYWMATSEHQSDIFDDYRVQGETPSAMKARVESEFVVPIPKNAWVKLMKHIAQAEHVKHLSRRYEVLKRLATDRKFKHEFKNKYGEDVYNTLLDQIENISLNKQTAKLDAITGLFGFMINNWVTAKVALNPNVFAKQLISVGNYMENMPSGEWVKGFTKGLKNPKKTFKFMWDNAKFLEARFNRGYSEALTEALRGAESVNKNMGEWSRFLSSWVRAGDITAIVFGGYPVVQYHISQGKSVEEAVKIFENQTLKAQQSGLSSGLSQFQNSKNPLSRLFLAFKNTPTQYFRKNIDAIISYANGDISRKQLAKVIGIYSFIQPALYAFVGKAMLSMYVSLGDIIQGEEGDDEFFAESFDAILMQIAISPFSAMPIIEDLVEYALRTATDKPTWKIFSFPFFEDFEQGIKTLSKDDKGAIDFLEIIGSFVEPLTGAPIKTPTRILNKILE